MPCNKKAKRLLLPFYYRAKKIAFIPYRMLFWVRAKTSITKRLDYAPSRISLVVESHRELHTRLHSAAKEPETVAWIEQTFSSGDVLYDIGANIGAYSLITGAAHNGTVKVYAFEPGFQNFNNLCRNIINNKQTEHIVPVQIAFSDKTEMHNFNYYDFKSGSALHTLHPEHNVKKRTPIWKQPMLCYALDDFIATFGVPHPSHLKIDVDGSEAEIISGARETIRNRQLKSLLIESTEQVMRHIVPILNASGFTEQSRHNRGGETYNYIFTRSR